jgi:DNA-directed RNA polymerase subunit alpha
MRIRWRGLELPSRVIRDESVSTDSYGRFIVEPFEHGFGTTIGNSLRRILLSSLEGAAVTSVKIAGVAHEFSSIDGVLEDVTDIILNIKGILVEMEGDEPKSMRLHVAEPGEVKAGQIEPEAGLTVVNPDHHLAVLTAPTAFHVDFAVGRGRGYATAAENRQPEQELGVIPVDSIFSPVLRVRYKTEDMRVGQKTNYDRLILEIWTRGTLRPEDALVEAGAILRKHLNPIVMYNEMGDKFSAPLQQSVPMETETERAKQELLDKPVSILNLSVRASNCLDQARIGTIRELVAKTEADLLRVRSFGKTSLHEVQRKLAEHGLALGLRFGDDAEIGVSPAHTPFKVIGGTETDPGVPTPPPGESTPGEPEAEEGNTTNRGHMEAFTMED